MQVQESVNAANFLSVGAATTKIGGEDEANVTDFASFLSTSGKTDDKSLGTASPEKELFPEKNNAVSKDSGRKNETVERGSDKKQIPTNSDNKVKRNLESNSTVSDTNIEAEEADASDITDVISAIEDILVYIMNRFDVAFEDIQSNLEQFGMEFEELFTTDGLKTFFLNMESADVSTLLTDEMLKADLESFISDIDTILDDEAVSVENIVTAFDDELISDDNFVNVQKNEAVDDETDESDYIPKDAEVVSRAGLKDTEIEVEVESNGKESRQSSSKDSGKSDSSIEVDNRNTIIQGINDAINNIEDVVPVSETAARPVEIVDQIVEQIRVNINETNTSMEMQLYPEHLGRIQIHVVSKDGVMTARIAAETETARQAIEAGLNNLKESLQNQNLKVDAIEVMVSTTAFAESDQRQDGYQQQGAGKRGSRIGFQEGEEEEAEDVIEAQKMQVEGSSVSYRA